MDSPRIAFVVGTLHKGGAEKQLVFLLKELVQLGVRVRVLTLNSGGFYEEVIRKLGLEVEYVGSASNPVSRLLRIRSKLREFRPDIVQAWHFYTNIYAAAVGRMTGAIAIGSVRNDVNKELATSGLWGPILLRCTQRIVANSYIARDNAASKGLAPDRLLVLPNIIDLEEFDRRAGDCSELPDLPAGPIVVAVAHARPVKRLDRFLRSLAAARKQVGSLSGLILGDGSELETLKSNARDLGLGDAVRFLGIRDDVPAILVRCSMFALTSDHEGFPNVLLEAMAARLPVVTTPAGDAARIVENEVTGYVVGFDDEHTIARHLVSLSQSDSLRRSLGDSGRRRVETVYAGGSFRESVLDTYIKIAESAQRPPVLAKFSHVAEQSTKAR